MMEEIGRFEATLNAPIGKVWAIFAAIGAEKAWLPGVVDCSLEGVGQGAVRTLRFDEYTAVEHIELCDPETHTIVYRLMDPSPIPAVGGFGTIQLSPRAPAQTHVEWVARADQVQGDRTALNTQISGFYGAAVQNIAGIIGCA